MGFTGFTIFTTATRTGALSTRLITLNTATKAAAAVTIRIFLLTLLTIGKTRKTLLSTLKPLAATTTASKKFVGTVLTLGRGTRRRKRTLRTLSATHLNPKVNGDRNNETKIQNDKDGKDGQGKSLKERTRLSRASPEKSPGRERKYIKRRQKRTAPEHAEVMKMESSSTVQESTMAATRRRTPNKIKPYLFSQLPFKGIHKGIRRRILQAREAPSKGTIAVHSLAVESYSHEAKN
ncbi:LOW QUALITY PROTEIN: hypothetical protein X943_002569 [Babesia divergens]|uniref:Uncharacterized protein n=1 Tax=Babesia divergens TaxID=32595 RepID=A0AAD9G7F6_BABDI|nr:LOW QUALITY PROTEIN: hypothetical protein X943_002569 [Babesia divergens]